MRAGLLLLALAFAGCLANAPAAVTPAATKGAAEPTWAQAARVFQFPAGDSYGIFVHDFLPDESFDVSGRADHGMVMDTSGLGKGSFYELIACAVSKNATRCGASSTGVDAAGRLPAAGAVADKETRTMFVVLLHAEQPASIRIGAWTGHITDSPKLPDANVTGAWDATGPADVSYYLSYGHAGVDRVETKTMSHNVRSDGTGLTPGSFATAGSSILSTSHHAEGATLEFASGYTWPEYGAGVARVAWTSEGKTATAAREWASAAFPASTGYAWVSGAHKGPSSFSYETDGVGALPQIQIDHSTVPLDLATLGLTMEPRDLGGSVLPVRGLPGASCAVAGPAFDCA